MKNPNSAELPLRSILSAIESKTDVELDALGPWGLNLRCIKNAAKQQAAEQPEGDAPDTTSPLVREANEKAVTVWKAAELSMYETEALYGAKAIPEEQIPLYGEGYRNGYAACYIQDRNTPQARASVAKWDSTQQAQGDAQRVGKVKECIDYLRRYDYTPGTEQVGIHDAVVSFAKQVAKFLEKAVA